VTLANSGFKDDITALILAGGRGSRMQGQDKGLALVNGRPLLSYVLDRIQPQVGQVLINANRNFETYSKFGCAVIADSAENEPFSGPLAGILAGLQACKTGYLLSIPCDTPCLPPYLVAQLFDKMQQEGADVATVNDGERLQPAIMLIRKGVIEVGLRDWLGQGGRAVQAWLAGQAHTILQDRAPQAYRNLNTRAELALFAQSLCK
jgi:molybdopterin-guanine dinucleotide biosynthesis protein A